MSGHPHRPRRVDCAEAQTGQRHAEAATADLMENAWTFTARQAGALIEFGAMVVECAAICCYVRDNGAGFDPPMHTSCSSHFSGCI
jgi:hypothetical protein